MAERDDDTVLTPNLAAVAYHAWPVNVAALGVLAVALSFEAPPAVHLVALVVSVGAIVVNTRWNARSICRLDADGIDVTYRRRRRHLAWGEISRLSAGRFPAFGGLGSPLLFVAATDGERLPVLATFRRPGDDPMRWLLLAAMAGHDVTVDVDAIAAEDVQRLETVLPDGYRLRLRRSRTQPWRFHIQQHPDGTVTSPMPAREARRKAAALLAVRLRDHLDLTPDHP